VTQEIAEVLRSAMVARGMTQRDVARLTGLTDPTISGVVNCTVGSSAELMVIADALGVPRFRVIAELGTDELELLEMWHRVSDEIQDAPSRDRLLAELRHRIDAEIALEASKKR